MSKIGLTIAAGLVVATGLWGMTHLAAVQEAIGDGGVAAIDATDEGAVPHDETEVELQGRTEATAATDPIGGDEVGTAVVPGSPTASGSTDATGADGSGEMSASAETPAAKPRRALTGAAAEFSRRSERDAERRLNELMQTERTGNLSFPGDNPLTDILESMSNALTESHDDQIKIRPDVKALAEDSIDLSAVIIKDIEIPEGLMTVGSALDYILSQTDPELTWIAKDEVLLITTMIAAESDEYMFLRSYDVSRLREISQLTATAWETSGQQGGGFGGGGGGFSLLTEPAQFGGGGMAPATDKKKKTRPSEPQPEESGAAQAKQATGNTLDAEFLISTIKELSGPTCRWYDTDGEGGRMSVAGNRLIVRQSRKGHEQVAAVLEQLELAADDAAEEKQEPGSKNILVR